jgi:hypothetical protein
MAKEHLALIMVVAAAFALPGWGATKPARILNCTLTGRVESTGQLSAKIIQLKNSPADGKQDHFTLTLVQNGQSYTAKGDILSLSTELRFTAAAEHNIATEQTWLSAPNPFGNGLEVIQLARLDGDPRGAYRLYYYHLSGQPGPRDPSDDSFSADYTYVGSCK